MKIQRNMSNRSIKLSDLWKNIKIVENKNDDLENLTINQSYTKYESIEPNPSTQGETEKEEYEKWVSSFEKDYVLNEAVLILSELNQDVAAND